MGRGGTVPLLFRLDLLPKGLVFLLEVVVVVLLHLKDFGCFVGGCCRLCRLVAISACT